MDRERLLAMRGGAASPHTAVAVARTRTGKNCVIVKFPVPGPRRSPAKLTQ